jgi:glycosyl transferase family 25
MNNQTLVLLINLDRRKDRLDKMNERLGNLPFTRIVALDGSKSEDILDSIKGSLGLNEKACIYSHVKALKFFLSTNYEKCIILEDDVIMTDFFFDLLSSDAEIPPDAIVVKLETMKARLWMSRFYCSLNGFKFHKLKSAHYGTAAYIVTRKGADIVIDALSQYDKPADDIIFDRLLALNHVYQLNPACCIQEFLVNDCFDSDIQYERNKKIVSSIRNNFFMKIYREIKRPLNQLITRIKRISQKYVSISLNE